MRKLLLLIAILSAASLVGSVNENDNIDNATNDIGSNDDGNVNNTTNDVVRSDEPSNGNDDATIKNDDNNGKTTNNSNDEVNDDVSDDGSVNKENTTSDVEDNDKANSGNDGSTATEADSNANNVNDDGSKDEVNSSNNVKTVNEDNENDETTNNSNDTNDVEKNDEATSDNDVSTVSEADSNDNNLNDDGNKDEVNSSNDVETANEDDENDETTNNSNDTNDVGKNDKATSDSDDGTVNKDDKINNTTSGIEDNDETNSGNDGSIVTEDNDNDTNDVENIDEKTSGNDNGTVDNNPNDFGSNGGANNVSDDGTVNKDYNTDNTTSDVEDNDEANSDNDVATLIVDNNDNDTNVVEGDETDNDNDAGTLNEDDYNNNNTTIVFDDNDMETNNKNDNTTNDFGNNDEANSDDDFGMPDEDDNVDSTTNNVNDTDNVGDNNIKSVMIAYGPQNDAKDSENNINVMEITSDSSSEFNDSETSGPNREPFDKNEISSGEENPDGGINSKSPSDKSFIPIVFKKVNKNYGEEIIKVKVKKVKPSNNDKDIRIQIKKGRYKSQQSKPGLFRRFINKVKSFFGFKKRSGTNESPTAESDIKDGNENKKSKPGFFRRFINRIKRFFGFGKDNNEKFKTKHVSNDTLILEAESDTADDVNDKFDFIQLQVKDASNEDEEPINPNDLTRMDKDSLKDVLETEVKKFKDKLFYVFDDEEKPIKLNLDIPDLYALNLTQDLDKSTVLFHLYTNYNKSIYDPLEVGNNEIFNVSHFSKLRPTVFITHGFLCSKKGPSITMIRDAYLNTRDVNVIVVDWSKISSKDYITARLLVPAIGKYIGKMINFLIENHGMKADTTTLIGHSLGAQIMGFAGQYTSQKINHTIGLDPARMLFTMVDKDQRISSDDANHVEIIHTNAGVLGFSRPTGDYDFYPNGGTLQNGCTRPELYDACSHNRSFRYLAEQLLRLGPEYYALQCESYGKFLTKQCTNNNITIMGELERVPAARGKYFLQTRATPPYGLGPHFRILTH